MAKKKKFKRGELLQDHSSGKIYIYVKRAKANEAHMVELNEHGDPVNFIVIKTKDLGPVKSIPETFKSISI